MFHARNMKWKFRTRAESLIETLVAITVIVIATTSAMILIRTSLVGNQVIGEKLVALNLALEGIEAVKNIRDTNYLNFSSDPDNCWNALGWTIDDPADCPDNLIDEDETYTITKNFRDAYNFQTWVMEASADPEDDGWLTLYEYEIENGPMEDDAPTVPFYLESGIAVFDEVNADAFQRLLTFEYDATEESFDVTVTVNWTVGEQEKSLTLTRNVGNVY